VTETSEFVQPLKRLFLFQANQQQLFLWTASERPILLGFNPVIKYVYIRCWTVLKIGAVCGSSEQHDGKSLRKVYRATALGRRALAAAKTQVRELFRAPIEQA
jgi:hypothetical protein